MNIRVFPKILLLTFGSQLHTGVNFIYFPKIPPNKLYNLRCKKVGNQVKNYAKLFLKNLLVKIK